MQEWEGHRENDERKDEEMEGWKDEGMEGEEEEKEG